MCVCVCACERERERERENVEQAGNMGQSRFRRKFLLCFIYVVAVLIYNGFVV